MLSPRALFALALALAVPSFSECRALFDPVNRAVARTDEAAQHDIAALPLPPSRSEHTPSVAPHVRVVLRRDGITADNARMVAAWSPEQRARATSTLPAGAPPTSLVRRERVVPLVDFVVPTEHLRGGASSLLVASLGATANRWAQQDHAAGAGSRDDDSVDVYADGATPAMTVVRVLYTLGMSEYSTYRLVVRAARGDVAVQIDTPQYGGHDEGGCRHVRVFLSGARISAGPGRPADEVVPPEARFNLDTAMRDVDPRDGHPDYALLVRLLRQLLSDFPVCPTALVTANDASYADLVGVLEVTRYDAGFERIFLGISREP